jgi:hypothetical protein
MSPENQALMADLLDWIAGRPRSRAEVMDAWRSSCPRLAIWEDALADGLVEFVRVKDAGSMVCVSDAGRAFLRRAGRRSADARPPAAVVTAAAAARPAAGPRPTPTRRFSPRSTAGAAPAR